MDFGTQKSKMSREGIHFLSRKLFRARRANPWECGHSGLWRRVSGCCEVFQQYFRVNTISQFLFMETILPSKKNSIFPSFNYLDFAKLNALRDWEPTSTNGKSQPPLFSADLCFLENRHWAMENMVKVLTFVLKGKTPFLSFTLASHTWQGKDQLSEESLVQNPAELSVELRKQWLGKKKSGETIFSLRYIAVLVLEHIYWVGWEVRLGFPKDVTEKPERSSWPTRYYICLIICVMYIIYSQLFWIDKKLVTHLQRNVLKKISQSIQFYFILY